MNIIIIISPLELLAVPQEAAGVARQGLEHRAVPDARAREGEGDGGHVARRVLRQALGPQRVQRRDLVDVQPPQAGVREVPAEHRDAAPVELAGRGPHAARNRREEHIKRIPINTYYYKLNLLSLSSLLIVVVLLMILLLLLLLLVLSLLLRAQRRGAGALARPARPPC